MGEQEYDLINQITVQLIKQVGGARYSEHFNEAI